LHFGRRDFDGSRFRARCVHRWVGVRRPRSDVVHRGIAGLSKISRLTHPVFKLEFSLRSNAWFLGLPRRRRPVKDWALFKGSEWVAFNADAGRTLLAVHPDVTAWFERSHIPDECYFQSVLHNAPDLVIDDLPLTWVPREPGVPTDGWMLLQTHHLGEVAESGAPFARKVDPHRNPDVIRAVNAEVDRRRSPDGVIA